MKQRGFTLIEIMVAMLILAGLSVILAQSVRTGLQDRKKIQAQLTEESLVRDTMRLIVSDVAAAFHHRDYTIALYNKVLELRKKKASGTQPGQAAGGADPAAQTGGAAAGQPAGATAATTTTATQADPLAIATPLPIPNQLTGFVGSGEAMTFTVRNHVRRFLDAKEGDQARVAYYLRSCRGVGPKAASSSCLVRLETTNPTDEFPLSPPDEEDNRGVILVRDVTEFKLRYIAQGQDEFTENWDSTGANATSNTKDKFPDAVEISLAVHDRSNPLAKERRLSWLAPIRASNNPDESDKEAAATPGASGATIPTQPAGGK